mgnify:CR=1 FL=1
MNTYNIISILTIMVLIPFSIYCFYANYRINENKRIASETTPLWRKIFLPPK